jgi:hypothetical protein
MNFTECESTLDGLSYVMRSKNPDLVKQGEEKLLKLRHSLSSLDSPRANSLRERLDYTLSTKVPARRMSDAIDEVFEDPHYLNNPIVVTVLIIVLLLSVSIYTVAVNKSLSAIGKN